MSEKHREDILCPGCGAESSFTVYDSVDGSNRVLKEKVLDGSLFTFTCPRCGRKEQISYFMLYYDIGKKLMLSFLGGSEAAGSGPAAVFFAKHSEQLGQLDYIKRIVNDQNALREKVMIFERGWDDRIVELIKVTYQKKIAEDHPELQLDAIFYAQGKNKEDLLLFYSGGKVAAAVDLKQNDLYKKAAELYGPELPPLTADKMQAIDGVWAVAFLNARP